VSWPVLSRDDRSARLLSLTALTGYLRTSGWDLADEDPRDLDVAAGKYSGG